MVHCVLLCLNALAALPFFLVGVMYLMEAIHGDVVQLSRICFVAQAGAVILVGLRGLMARWARRRHAIASSLLLGLLGLPFAFVLYEFPRHDEGVIFAVIYVSGGCIVAFFMGLISLVVSLVCPANVRPPGHCTQCGYDLTGNASGRCPECGAPRAGPGSAGPKCRRPRG